VDRTKTPVTERLAPPIAEIVGRFPSRRRSYGFKLGARETEGVTPWMIEILKRSFGYIGAFREGLNPF
jgi:hypothetical protein